MFTSSDTVVTLLTQELEFARAYLEIEKVRFGIGCNTNCQATPTLKVSAFPFSPYSH